MLETDVGKVVAAWLRDQHWAIYAEVIGPGGMIADMVARRGPVVVAIELKTRLSFEVLDQAMRWREHAHLVYAAAPYQGAEPPRIVRVACEAAGIGLLQIRDSPLSHPGVPAIERAGVHEAVAPRFNGRPTDRLRNALAEEHKTYTLAGASGNVPRWSPFKTTQRVLLAYVRKHPGCTAKDVIEHCSAPHITARTQKRNVVRWLDTGLIPGVRVERDGRTPRFYPIEEAEKA